RAAGSAEVHDLLPELQPALRIEARGGLVEEEHLRIADQGTGHGQALLLAARELADPGVAFLLQGEADEHGFRVPSSPVEGAEEAHRLEHRQLLVELCLLERDTEPFAKLAPVALPGA